MGRSALILAHFLVVVIVFSAAGLSSHRWLPSVPLQVFQTSTTTGGAQLEFVNATSPLGSNPESVASNNAGSVFGVFHKLTGGYVLGASSDFLTWIVANQNLIPNGYAVCTGRGLAVTSRGVILVSITRFDPISRHNATIFEASFDQGKTFSVVLNVTLRATEFYGPGCGFWRGVVETSNGTLFAGLYRPQALIFKSVDFGRSWFLVFNASSYGPWTTEIHDLQVDPIHDFVYATTHEEVYNASIWVSRDYGANWERLYARGSGGSGLPTEWLPLSMAFIHDSTGEYMVLGDDHTPTRRLALLRVEPTGDLQQVQIFSAESTLDYFAAWQLYSYDKSEVFVLTWDLQQPAQSGAGLFTLTINGLKLLLTLPSKGGTVAFLEMAGVSSTHRYGVLVTQNGGITRSILVFTYTATPVPEFPVLPEMIAAVFVMVLFFASYRSRHRARTNIQSSTQDAH